MRLLRSFLTLAGIAFLVASCDSTSTEPDGQDEDSNTAEDDDGAEDEAAEKDSGSRGRDGSVDAGRMSSRDAGGGLLDAALTREGGAANPGDARSADGSQVTSDAGGSSSEGGSVSGDYSPCPTNGDPCKILPLGDSITVGLGDRTGGGYRAELFKKTLAAGQKITFLGSQRGGPAMVDGAAFPSNHEGYSGWTIMQIAGLVPDPALDETPHIILLMAGTNDVVWAGPEGAPMRLDMLIKTITEEAPDALLVVAQLTPLGDPATDGRAKTFNEAVPAIIEKHADAGKHVLLVDMHTGVPASGISTDRVHPNLDGYKAMADVWYEAIAPVLP